MRKVHHYIILIALLISLQSCDLGTENVSSQLFPNPPDTTNLLAFSSHINPEQIAEIISAQTFLRNGEKRKVCNPDAPKNGDDFRDYHFDEVQWRMIQIQDADFRGSYLRAANCNISDFSYSDFRVGDLESAKFLNATLESCKFDQASLLYLFAEHALFDGSTFRGTNMFDMQAFGASFRYCNFSNALMRDGQFGESDFTGSTAIRTNFIGAVLIDAKLDSSDLSYAKFNGAALEGASFINARIHYADFQEANLTNTNFSGADLKGCNFVGAEFNESLFKDAINIPDNIKSKLVNHQISGVLYKE